MTVRGFLKSLVPPLLLAPLRRLFQKKQACIWDGIYQHLRDVPAQRGSYQNEDRISEMLGNAKDLLEQVRAGRKPLFWHDMLATVSATICAANGRVTVVDFGGGIGTGFIQLLAMLPRGSGIEYHVVDLEGMCAAGRNLFASEARIQFHTALGSVGTAPDIIYVNSVIQYIEDYAGQLRQLAQLEAPWLLLARLAAGDFPSFATRQLNLPGQVLAHWFLSRDEVIRILSCSGYRLALEGLDNREYDMSNFPTTHRCGRQLNLLFARETPFPDRA